MNLIIKELLSTKAHIGKKGWNRETASYVLGLRSSRCLEVKKASYMESFVGGFATQNGAAPGAKKKILKSYSKYGRKTLNPSRLKFSKGRSPFLYNIFDLEKTIFSLSQSLSFLNNFSKTAEPNSPPNSPNAFSPKNPHILIVSGKVNDPSGSFHFDICKILKEWKRPLIQSPTNLDLTRKLVSGNLVRERKTNPDFLPLAKTKNVFSEAREGSSFHPILSFVQEKWVGGMLTNWKQVSNSLRIYSQFKFKFENFLQKHKIHFPIFEKYNKRYLGLKEMGNTLPNILIITNPEENEILLKEAFILKIPIIAFINSDIPKNLMHCIQYPIPGNNTSPHFLYFCLNLLLMSASFKK